MPGVLYLRNVLQFIIHRFYNSPLSEQQFVRDVHQCSFHVAFQLGNKLYAINEKPLEETDQMQLESEEPAHGAFPSLGNALENFVNVYSLIPADAKRRTVNKADDCAFARQDLLDKQG